MNILGSTEIGVMPLWEHDSEDWEYFHHSPALKGIEFRPIGDGETYELVLVRHPSTDPYHGTWYTFPDLEEYSTNDIYTKHPSKPNLWLYVSRADDIIVLSNGEKFNPVSMQIKIQEHPHIKGVIVVGQGKFAAAAVIELNDHIAQTLITREDRWRVIDDIWSKVEEANGAAPGHGRLGRDKIILAKSEKPFPRAGKGTVQRKAAIMLYQDEIEDIYNKSGEDDLDELPAIDLSDFENLEKSVENLVHRVIHVETLPRNQDFFTAGMDSLHVMTIAKKLRAAVIGIPKDTISPRLVYSNPTVSALATALKNNLDGRSSGSLTRDVTVMQLLERYLNRLPVAPSAIKRNPRDGLTVILTGSTGSLGSYLLDSLFSNRNITKIYCINRRADAAEYQSRINAARGLISEWADRAVFLHADLSKTNFGLPIRIFESLRNETSVIIRESTYSCNLTVR
jgi:aryl carrier-like protein